jgi:hypothetical protein
VDNDALSCCLSYPLVNSKDTWYFSAMDLDVEELCTFSAVHPLDTRAYLTSSTSLGFKHLRETAVFPGSNSSDVTSDGGGSLEYLEVMIGAILDCDGTTYTSNGWGVLPKCCTGGSPKSTKRCNMYDVIASIQDATLSSRFDKLRKRLEGFKTSTCFGVNVTVTNTTILENTYFVGQLFGLRDCEGDNANSEKCETASNDLTTHLGTEQLADFFGIGRMPITYLHDCANSTESDVTESLLNGVSPADLFGSREPDPYSLCGPDPVDSFGGSRPKKPHDLGNILADISQVRTACFFFEPECSKTSPVDALLEESCLTADQLYAAAAFEVQPLDNPVLLLDSFRELLDDIAVLMTSEKINSVFAEHVRKVDEAVLTRLFDGPDKYAEDIASHLLYCEQVPAKLIQEKTCSSIDDLFALTCGPFTVGCKAKCTPHFCGSGLLTYEDFVLFKEDYISLYLEGSSVTNAGADLHFLNVYDPQSIADFSDEKGGGPGKKDGPRSKGGQANKMYCDSVPSGCVSFLVWLASPLTAFAWNPSSDSAVHDNMEFFFSLKFDLDTHFADWAFADDLLAYVDYDDLNHLKDEFKESDPSSVYCDLPNSMCKNVAAYVSPLIYNTNSSEGWLKFVTDLESNFQSRSYLNRDLLIMSAAKLEELVLDPVLAATGWLGSNWIDSSSAFVDKAVVYWIANSPEPAPVPGVQATFAPTAASTTAPTFDGQIVTNSPTRVGHTSSPTPSPSKAKSKQKSKAKATKTSSAGVIIGVSSGAVVLGLVASLFLVKSRVATRGKGVGGQARGGSGANDHDLAISAEWDEGAWNEDENDEFDFEVEQGNEIGIVQRRRGANEETGE